MKTFEIGKMYFDNYTADYLKVVSVDGDNYTCERYFVHPCDEDNLVYLETINLLRSEIQDPNRYEVV